MGWDAVSSYYTDESRHITLEQGPVTQPPTSEPSDIQIVFRCSVIMRFITPEGEKIMHPGRKYDSSMNEITPNQNCSIKKTNEKIKMSSTAITGTASEFISDH